MKMDWSVLEEKAYFKMLGLWFSSKLNWGSYIVSIAKNAYKKSFFLLRLFFISTNLLYDLAYHATVVMHGLVLPVATWTYLLGKLQILVRKTALAASFEALTHHQNLASLIKACVRYFLSNFYFSPNDSPSKTMKNIFHFITLVDVYTNWLNWFRFLDLGGGPFIIHDFL